jgi:hypothetical protein
MHGPNVWPDPTELPGWEQQVQTYFTAMLHLSRVIARGLALSLSLPESFFTDKMRDPVAQLLLLRYPPAPRPQGVAAAAGGQEQHYVGCGAHTDCGFLTILAQVREEGCDVDAVQVLVAPVGCCSAAGCGTTSVKSAGASASTTHERPACQSPNQSQTHAASRQHSPVVLDTHQQWYLIMPQQEGSTLLSGSSST